MGESYDGRAAVPSISREGVVRRWWRSCASRGSVTQVVGASYDGRAAVPSISREGVTQKSCRVTATSHAAVCLFPTTEVTEASRRSRSAVWLGYNLYINFRKIVTYFHEGGCRCIVLTGLSISMRLLV